MEKALTLNIVEAARLAGIGQHLMRQLVRSGEVRSIAVGKTGTVRRVPVEAVEEWVRTAARGGE